MYRRLATFVDADTEIYIFAQSFKDKESKWLNKKTESEQKISKQDIISIEYCWVLL